MCITASLSGLSLLIRKKPYSEVRVPALGEGAGGCACDEDRRQAREADFCLSGAKEQHDHNNIS